ncbi:MAG: N(4)-(beta-N-acetylglucosaminyl)-L-asparaginase [Gammaproteobacteria bacterium]|nr:N(4)-(beta-N-acetylglucosaminyl)-L-asparaginase [Gammaproteobacteria bacterium]
MNNKIGRREFVLTGAAAGLSATAISTVQAAAPAVHTGASKPVVVSSANGFTMKNGGKLNCVETAFDRMAKGEDVLDALIAGVNIVELDPEDASVGYGGRPNADGVVQLDSCCMHGPKKQAGGVAAIEGVRTPSLVAKAVMEFTDHHLIVGQGATEFARSLGFKIEDDLNTENSRRMWLDWKRRIDPDHYLDPKLRVAAGHEAGLEMVTEGLIGEDEYYGTINCNGVNHKGDVCGVTTTSGLSWKIPGRAGDSPVLGAGLYVDGDYGAAGSTGRGEANLFGLCSFVVVEELRRGKSPLDAGMEALRRIQRNTVEKRLLNSRALPGFNVSFYVINKAGDYAGVAMYSHNDERRFAVCTENGAELAKVEALLEGSAAS